MQSPRPEDWQLVAVKPGCAKGDWLVRIALTQFRAPCKGTVRQRQTDLPGNSRSSHHG